MANAFLMSIASMNWMGIMYWLFVILFYFSIALCLFIYYFRYNIEVRLHMYRGKGVIVKKCVGRIITKKDSAAREFKILFRQKKMPCPSNEYILPQRSMLRRNVINLFEDAHNDLHPIEFVENSPVSYSVNEQNSRFWIAQSFSDSEKLWGQQSFFAKYGQQIIFMSGVAVIFILSLILIYQIKDVSEALRQVATSLSSIGAPKL